MKGHRKTIGLTMFLVFLLWAKTYSSTNQVQTYVSREGSRSLALVWSSNYLLAQQKEDTIRVGTSDSLKLKSPYMAIFYAFVPGIVIHGSGHVYAGEIPTGMVLFGSELLGLGLIFLGGVSGIESGEPSNGGENAIFIGTLLFVGSWLYDIIESPIVVKKRNKDLFHVKFNELKFQAKHGESKLFIVWRF